MASSSLELPPRRHCEKQEMTILRNQSSLEIMVQMGFPKKRVEKALAATGDKGVQLASDWLLAHVNDPKLDGECPRDYILYLCPVGQLQQEFLDFWQKTYQECGWNKAHNYFPHMTLSSFFQAEDSMVSQLSHVLKIVAEKVSGAPEFLEFEMFSSLWYIGLFVTEKYVEFLKNITGNFAEEMKKMGVEVEVHKKQLHVSLAYHFSSDKQEKLSRLSREINLKLPARWDLRIYSRCQTEPNCQVRRVLFPYTSSSCDELDLCPGDFLIVKEVDVQASEDGWCMGASWMSGCSGMFPLVYTERTAETETWTMHKSIPIIGTDLNVDTNSIAEESLETLRTSRYLSSANSSSKQPKGYATMPAFLSYPSTQSTSQILDAKSSPSSLSSSASSATSLVIAGSVSAATGIAVSTLSSPTQSGTNQNTADVQSSPAVQTSSETSQAASTAAAISTASLVSPAATKVIGPPIAVFTTKNKPKEVLKNHSTSSKPAQHLNHPKFSESAPAASQPVSKEADPCELLGSQAAQDSNLSKESFGISSSNQVPSVFNPSQSPMSINTFCRMPAVDNITSSLPIASLKGPRQLYVVRHGESINSTFGRDWIQNSFNQSGKYTRYDLNMPKLMPARQTGPEEFANDSPLTVQGCFQSRLLGEAMKEKSINLPHVYSSPSLKCVQSAANLLESLQSPSKIRIEPGFFDWLGSCKQNGLPRFMSPEELVMEGYPVDPTYQAIHSINKLLGNSEESIEQFFERSYIVTKEILKKHETEGGSILLMTHAGNLDSCTRKLVGQPCRSTLGYQEIARKIPYCAVCVAQEATVVLDTWYLIEPPTLPFAHSNNPKYNWTSLTTPGLL